ncbi:hypothetical protein AYO20_10462 [Fonsecaea nubica]|uniref:F-box domain-containing protein n=1 Tax=Fonsecaea nubica TaxID=856822 RepID=A0A178C653_9EURO|nr:hypothetical protein AYO20_10462 [Fonsecaea nubica]OAL25428.1 hypothetical protein AYO20_10462 [Fonsecaea nubica]
MASFFAKPLEPAYLTSAEQRFLSKQPDYNKLIIDSEELRRRIWLSHPRSWTITRGQRSAGLGDLDRLPLELQVYLFARTPVNTLFNLRATNTHAKQLVEQWQPFRAVITHGADAIRALLATGAGHMWTVPQLVDVLFTTKCEFCEDHGEILHLLQLKRCCFRCLSQERELLAVNLGYAQGTMGLSHDELRKLPQLVTVPQNCFWGFPAERGYIFDYKSAVEVRRQQGPTTTMVEGQVPPAPCQIPLMRTGFRLTADQCSIQPRPKSSIQARRCQTGLRLLDEEISPPETTYAQHACAVRLPALRRQSRRVADGSLQTTISKIEAVHCGGCAYYWNYHSALPWEFHRLYPHQQGEVNSEFHRHLRHCVYARLQWRWIHKPLRPIPTEMVREFLKSFRLSYFPRHGSFNAAVENASFETIPDDVMALMDSSDADFNAFSPQYTWPELKDENESWMPKRLSHASYLQLERMTATARLHPIDKQDHYWDSLVSKEAVSQANWACANVHSGRVSLFRGPASVLAEKRQLREKKFRAEGRLSGRQPEWGFGQFYL